MKLRNFFCASSQSNLQQLVGCAHTTTLLTYDLTSSNRTNEKGEIKIFNRTVVLCGHTATPFLSFYSKGTDHAPHIAETSLSFDLQSIKSLSLATLPPLHTPAPLQYINHHTSSIRTRTVSTPQSNHLSSMLLPTETPRLLLTTL
jgi:hypothetical protein